MELSRLRLARFERRDSPSNTRGIYHVRSVDRVRRVDVFDVRGQLIHRIEVPGSATVIDLVDRATGVYLVRIVTATDVRTVRIVR